ncbi:MAG TPA: hypothetical protein VH144_00810 [Candidatus Saccharimonadales bacterium]|jgi:hypothetical protein|nr:hypothetical protein [Candidatus Saccharimonadales bacterium]
MFDPEKLTRIENFPSPLSPDQCWPVAPESAQDQVIWGETHTWQEWDQYRQLPPKTPEETEHQTNFAKVQSAVGPYGTFDDMARSWEALRYARRAYYGSLGEVAREAKALILAIDTLREQSIKEQLENLNATVQQNDDLWVRFVIRGDATTPNQVFMAQLDSFGLETDKSGLDEKKPAVYIKSKNGQPGSLPKGAILDGLFIGSINGPYTQVD